MTLREYVNQKYNKEPEELEGLEAIGVEIAAKAGEIRDIILKKDNNVDEKTASEFGFNLAMSAAAKALGKPDMFNKLITYDI
jgi:hypothetical protein